MKLQLKCSLIIITISSCNVIEDSNIGYIKRNGKVFFSSEVNIGKGGTGALFEISEADYPSFNILSSNYAIDKKHVYYRINILDTADINSFVDLEGFYARDDSYVYYDGLIIHGADPGSIEVFHSLTNRNHFIAKDNKNIIMNGRIVSYSK